MEYKIAAPIENIGFIRSFFDANPGVQTVEFACVLREEGELDSLKAHISPWGDLVSITFDYPVNDFKIVIDDKLMTHEKYDVAKVTFSPPIPRGKLDCPITFSRPVHSPLHAVATFTSHRTGPGMRMFNSTKHEVKIEKRPQVITLSPV